METNLFVFIINHNTITGCKTMTSIVLQISKIHCKLSEVCSLNYASPEPEPVLTHLSRHFYFQSQIFIPNSVLIMQSSSGELASLYACVSVHQG